LDLANHSAKSLKLFDLILDLDRTLAQRKAKSKVKVTHCTKNDDESTVWDEAK